MPIPPDFSTSTDFDVRLLAAHGNCPEVREAARAELARRYALEGVAPVLPAGLPNGLVALRTDDGRTLSVLTRDEARALLAALDEVLR